ncbi:thioredoxin-like protein [Hypoxylon trugodes]|uniref:thioredoxin-like protein n=1 Tax=Hypoxylon trugodes TaxID=326681 RepID=UPI00218E1907|nr:thioredoxin-like protein [Hypoxylon trugodes]KAI1384302.1 thioredoxin-like protein [Hypoxylon trugodes]
MPAVIENFVIADITCAWCYIAKRNLDKAIELYRKTYPGGKFDIVTVVWEHYYLNYNTLPYSVDKSVLAAERLAHLTPDQHEALTRRMERAGRAAGIEFRWGGKIGPDTRQAHRLIRLAALKGVANDVVEGLFEAYHSLELDISEREVLRGIAIRGGIDDTEIDEYLDSDEDAELVDEVAMKNKEKYRGSGVPTFVIKGQHGEYRLEGAQDPMDILEVFIKVREGEGEGA